MPDDPRPKPLPIEPQQPSGLTPQQKGAAVGGSLAVAVAAILGAVYADEGGYVNHPNDPGGATKYGITQLVARQAGYRGNMRDFPKHCSATAPVCADSIYLRQYFQAPGFMPLVSIEPAVADEMINTAVNMGAPRPSKWLQQSLNEQGAHLVVDGKVGAATIAAYRATQIRYGKVAACVVILNSLDNKQLAEYGRLVAHNPKLSVFYRGWVNNRIGNVDRAQCGKGWADPPVTPKPSPADYPQCVTVNPGPLRPPKADVFHPRVAVEVT